MPGGIVTSSVPPSGSVMRLFAPGDRLGELDCESVMQVLAAPVRLRALSAAQQLGEPAFFVHEVGIGAAAGVGMSLVRIGEIAIISLAAAVRRRSRRSRQRRTACASRRR